jgi:hypothetical protein
LSHFGSTFR